MTFAYKFSTSESGTMADADFYILIQNSIMMIFGILMGCYPTFSQPGSTAKRWAHILAVIGTTCCISAIPIYLYFATIWSAWVSFVAALVQGYMVLQLAIAGNDLEHLKED
jgi:uncharacterized membrane protein